jgi:hypothetical protein
MDDEWGDGLFGGLSPEQADDVLAAVSRLVHPKGGASDWTLQKTYYLACVESIEDRLAPLPNPRFFSWKFGPWSKDLRNLMDLAADVGNFEVALVPSKHQAVTKVYRWPQGKPTLPMRNSADATFLDEYVARVADLSGEQLTALAKQTIPYRNTPYLRPIDLDKYLQERRAAIDKLSDDERLAGLLAEPDH